MDALIKGSSQVQDRKHSGGEENKPEIPSGHDRPHVENTSASHIGRFIQMAPIPDDPVPLAPYLVLRPVGGLEKNAVLKREAAKWAGTGVGEVGAGWMKWV